MKKTSNLICAAAVGMMALCSSSANATSYYFSQGGYSGGGSITGTFDGIDLNNDGRIVSFDGEVVNFSLSFSGDYAVGDFTHTLIDLFGLVYDVNSGFIGDAVDGFEGVASNWAAGGSGSGYGVDYASGLAATGELGGRVTDIATGATSSSLYLISVSAVPEPETWGMLLAGVGLVGLRMRQRSRTSRRVAIN